MTYYYMLISSLPRHGREYKIKQTPISRIQLEKRLTLLTETERNILYNLIHCLWNSWFDANSSIQATLKISDKLFTINNTFIDQLIHWFFDVRSVFVALRLRQRQSSPPAHTNTIWFTQWNTRLIKNWQLPHFGLQSVYPWLPAVNLNMQNKNSAEVENILLTLIWQHLNSIEDRHFYDFEALVIYLLRWNIVNYWSQFNEEKGLDSIRELSEKIVADRSLS